METFLQYISCYDIVLENWEVSQSLFYWKPFCNINNNMDLKTLEEVAILILLETFLQF